MQPTRNLCTNLNKINLTAFNDNCYQNGVINTLLSMECQERSQT